MAESSGGRQPTPRAARSSAARAPFAAFFLTCLLALGVPLLSEAPASPPPPPSGWTSPVSLLSLTGPRVVLTGEGTAAAVWAGQLEGRWVVEADARVDGHWKSSSVVGADSFEPSIAVGPGGGAIAVWAGHRGVEAAAETAAGGWSSLPTIPHTSGAFAPEIATDAEGTATVVWREPGPGQTTIEAATRPAGAAWSSATRLSRPGHAALAPQLAVDPDGAAAVIWRRSDGKKSIVQAATRDRAGRWSAPADLSAPGENAVAPAVAIDPDGEAVGIWDRFDGAHQIIEVAEHHRGGRWSRPVDLSAAGRNAEEPEVAIGTGGEAVAVWERFDGRVDRVEEATRIGEGRWTRPRGISRTGRSSHEPQAAVDPDGVARVVWVATEAHGASVEESSSPPAGNWSAPVRLARGPGRRREPAVAVAAGGEAVAIWGGEDGAAAFLSPAPAH